MKRILCIGLCLLIGAGVFAERVAELDTATAYSVEQIANEGSIGTLYEEFVFTYLPIIPPAPSEMFLQPVGRPIVFDESTFKRRFLSNLIGEMHPVSGAPVYTVFAMMEASTFDVVLFNENLLELARISRPKTYRPFLWAESRFGTDLTPELMALYNPARMIAEYKLISVDYAGYHIAALERQSALEAATVSMASPSKSDGVSIRRATAPTTPALTENEEPLMAMALAAPPPPGGGRNSPPAGSGGGSSNLVMELAITMPLDCGPYVEIFQKQNLIYPQLWNVAVNKMAVTGGVETIWADPASSNAATMFYIVGDTSAGFDDGDGYSELRERHVENSNPFVFDFRDTDSDGLHDWLEIMAFGAISAQSGSDDFDGDSLSNNEEWVLEGTTNVLVVSDPTVFDTDGDGTDDGTEVAQGSNPSDPSDNGEPPEPPATNETVAVSLSIKSYNPDVGFTLSLSRGSTNHTVASLGTQTVSNSFELAKGHTYELSLTQQGFSQCGGEWGYVADVSGTGIIVADPDGILGDQWQNDAIQGSATAAVHVVKIKTQTVATAPADRTRKTIGVGEAVDLTFLPSGLSPISWARSGAGDLDETTGNPVTFTSSDVASNSTITATYDGHDFSVAFTTIEPTGVLFENDLLLIASVPSAGDDRYTGYYSAKVYVQPDTVNFGNIELYESAAPSEKEGYFEDKDIPDHEANGGHDVDGYEEGKGSSMKGSDWIALAADGSPYSDGTITWSLDWFYAVGSGDQTKIETVYQVAELNVETNVTTFTLTKDSSGVYVDTEDEEGNWIE